MKIYSPLFLIARIVVYALVLFGMAEGIFYDAAHPLGDSYFGEITFTEITQEIILFILFVFFLVFGFKWPKIQVVSVAFSLFFLMSFIREFNFIIDKWIYPVLTVLAVLIWFSVKNFRKIKGATIAFFSVPASAWLLSGFLLTYIFSRLMGRSKFWRLMYEGESYRLAKAATEEGLELAGNTIMLFAAVEFVLFYVYQKKEE
ncbi:MAG: hypothetical protein R2757_01140 [Draconibacterium sp.]|jgi:hypothetical protein